MERQNDKLQVSPVQFRTAGLPVERTVSDAMSSNMQPYSQRQVSHNPAD